MRRAPSVRLARGERPRLLELARSPPSTQRVAARARIVLRAAEGADDRTIARELACTPGTVALWRRRFLAQRVPGLLREAPRPGRPPSLPPAQVREIVRMTLGRRPAGGGPWTARAMAREAGVSKTTVQRIWRAHQIEPQRAVETFRRNPGARFVENVTDLVGLYYHPPDRAMAFSVDLKGRTSSGLLPLEPRRLARSEEDRRASEFRQFLQAIDRETPHDLDVHLLLDGRLAPSAAEVRRWLDHHPRFFLHFLPTERTGPNLIDRWWAGFSRARVRSTASPGVARLRRAFRHHFGLASSVERAFVWTANSDEIRGGRARSSARTVRSAGRGQTPDESPGR